MQKNRSLLLRFDASKTRGLGHLVRSIALAEAASDNGWRVTLCADVDSEFGISLIQSSGYDWIPSVPFSDITAFAVDYSFSVVHFDTYDRLPSDLLAAMRTQKILMSSIEDGEHGRRDADVVVDASPVALTRLRQSTYSTTLLLGPAYAPLRKNVRIARQNRRNFGRTSELRVLVVMGGTDVHGLANIVANSWLKLDINSTLTIIGKPFPVECKPDQSVRFIDPHPGLADMLASQDLVISASGTTVWELATIGTPAALIKVVENQSENYNFFTANNIGFPLGDSVDILSNPNILDNSFRDLLSDESLNSNCTVEIGDFEDFDGRGALRIVQEWSHLIHGAISCREARPSDASLLYNWRNEEQVRLSSRTTTPLFWEDHLKWVLSTIENPEVVLYILEKESQPIGTVRYDSLSETGHWEVSITISPTWRGRGVAKQVLSAAEDKFLQNNTCTNLIAVTNMNNSASCNLFNSIGYELESNTGEWITLKKEFECKW